MSGRAKVRDGSEATLLRRLEVWCAGEGLDLEHVGSGRCLFDDEPMTIGEAAARAKVLAPAPWDETAGLGTVIGRVEVWAAKLEHAPKRDYALELAAASLSGGVISSDWLREPRPWMVRVQHKLETTFRVPGVGACLIRSEEAALASV